MSREIVPVEFINFLWRDSNCTNLLVSEEGTPPAFADPPPSRVKRYDGIRSFNLQDRSLSSPSPPPPLKARETLVHAMYDILRRISPHLQPSAECWFSLPWMNVPVSSSKSSISDLLLEELPTFHSKETSSRVKRRTRIRSGSKKINCIINFTQQPFARFN